MQVINFLPLAFILMWVPSYAFSAGKKEVCAKFEGQLISYYEDVFLIENCKRRKFMASTLVYEKLKWGSKITEVEGDVVRQIPEGLPIEKQHRDYSCKDIEDRYVTVGFTEIYLVEGCKKRLFPDWTSFLDHSYNREKSRREIIDLEANQFHKFAMGKPMPSALDQEPVIKGMEDEADVIPLSEACRGLEGKYVKYYSRIYKIVKCRKREIDPDVLLKEPTGKNLNFIELTSGQWISLPAGEDLKSF